MLAVIQTGRQYLVKAGIASRSKKIAGEAGADVTFDSVLLTAVMTAAA